MGENYLVCGADVRDTRENNYGRGYVVLEKLGNDLRQEIEILSYLRLLKEAADYCIVVTINDTVGVDYFTSECSKELQSMGLKIDMFNIYQKPYIAVIDRGNVIYEKTNDLEKPVLIKGRLYQHDLFVM